MSDSLNLEAEKKRKGEGERREGGKEKENGLCNRLYEFLLSVLVRVVWRGAIV